MTPQRKHTGGLFGVFLLLLIGGLMLLLAAGEQFFGAVSDAVKVSARAVPSTKAQTLKNTRPVQAKLENDVKYRKFSLTAPNAEKVELLADFNDWGKYPLPLKNNGKGYFETTLVLSAGEYKYVFLVDGKEMPDPTNAERRTFGGRKVSVKSVK